MSEKYKNYSQEDLILEIENLKRKKKFGLVWEINPEQEIERLKNEAPYLIEKSDRSIINDSDKPTNLLIEGDNYHSLLALNYTHKEAIDVIYIDPPYNTGAKDWKYNNDYVDEEDSFRHSKWINMMYQRLKLSKNLLSEDGIIICAIDEYELYNLGLLMDEIFLERNKIGLVVVRNNPPGRAQSNYFARQHEYLLFYAKNKSNVIINNLNNDNKEVRERSLTSRGGMYIENRPQNYFPIYFNSINNQLSLNNSSDYIEIYPPISNGRQRVWDNPKHIVAEFIENNELVCKLIQNQYKIYRINNPNKGIKPKTIWTDAKYDSSEYGASLLLEIFGEKKFDYPKSLYAVIDSLTAASAKKNAIILDFFAGSGTTGHAVLEMNKIDSGTRRFILCTNNDNGIAENITYQRIKHVIKGYKGVFNKKEYQGLGGNLKYFKTEFIPYQNTDANIKRYSSNLTELIKIKEDTFEFYSKKNEIEIYQNENKYLVILNDYEIEKACNIIKTLDQGKEVVVYIFSLSDEDFDEDFNDLQSKVISSSFPIPMINILQKVMK